MHLIVEHKFVVNSSDMCSGECLVFLCHAHLPGDVNFISFYVCICITDLSTISTEIFQMSLENRNKIDHKLHLC